MALLNYEQVSAITYRATDIGIRLTPEQQSLLVQAISLFTDPALWDDYDTYADDIDALVAAAEYQLQIEEAYPVTIGGTSADFWLNFATATPSMSFASLLAQPFEFYMQTPGTTPGDEILSTLAYLQAGTYEYRGLWYRFTDRGIVEADLLNEHGSVRESIFSNFDMYGATAANQVKLVTFAISSSQLFAIRLRITSKNASSSGYRIAWTSHHLTRIG